MQDYTTERDEMTAIDILECWMIENGYDGLCYPEHECGCRIGDLMPCGSYCGECQPGYLHQHSADPYDYDILTTKPGVENEEEATVETPEAV